MKIYDISQEVFSCQVYPGDPAPERQVLAIMAFGVALSVKSDLGVSPISSIPYTMTCVAGIINVSNIIGYAVSLMEEPA